MNTRQHLFALLSIVTSGRLLEKQVSSPIGTTKNSANHKSKPRRRSHWPAPLTQDRGPSSEQPTGNSTTCLTEPSQQREPPSTYFLPSARVHPRLRAIQMFHLGDMTVAKQPLVWQDITPSSVPTSSALNPSPSGLPGWLFTCTRPFRAASARPAASRPRSRSRGRAPRTPSSGSRYSISPGRLPPPAVRCAEGFTPRGRRNKW